MADHDTIGGPEVMLLLTAQACADLGHEVVVWTPTDRGEVARAADARGFGIHGLRAGTPGQYMRRLRRALRRNPPELVWCHGLRPSVATAGLPNRIVHVHQHLRRTQRSALRRATRGAAAVVAPSADLAATIRGARILWNWCEPIAPAPHNASATLRVGFLGRLSMGKGIGVLTRALAELPAAELVLAGTPRFVMSTERRATEQALARVADRTTRLGWVTAADLFERIDVLVVPPVAAESFGLVTIEAMAGRVPLIVSDAGALPEITGEDYPLCVRAGDAHAVAAALRTVSAMSASQLTELTDSLAERWAQHFSPQVGRARVAALLDTLELTHG